MTILQFGFFDEVWCSVICRLYVGARAEFSNCAMKLSSIAGACASREWIEGILRDATTRQRASS